MCFKILLTKNPFTPPLLYKNSFLCSICVSRLSEGASVLENDNKLQVNTNSKQFGMV